MEQSELLYHLTVHPGLRDIEESVWGSVRQLMISPNTIVQAFKNATWCDERLEKQFLAAAAEIQRVPFLELAQCDAPLCIPEQFSAADLLDWKFVPLRWNTNNAQPVVMIATCDPYRLPFDQFRDNGLFAGFRLKFGYVTSGSLHKKLFSPLEYSG